MSELRDRVLELRARFAEAATLPERDECLKQLDSLEKTVEAQAAQLQRLRRDVEDAERVRDAASLARMRVFGQLNTLHKTLTAATPKYEGETAGEPQHIALRRIEWLASRGGTDPSAALAAKEAEMEAPIPGQAVLEAVIAGQRRFTKGQLEFSLSEAIVLTNWELTPLEIMEKGEPWLAELILKNNAAPSHD